MDMDSLDDDGSKKFGLNRRIMFAAVFSLFAVVIFTVILHLYARYLMQRRERRRQIFIQSLRAQITPIDGSSDVEPIPKRGLDPIVIASLPLFSYKSTSQQQEGGQGEEPLECSVCLGNITEETMVRILPNCKHMFHSECIDMWLGSHTTCPICRTTVEPTVQPEEPTAPPIEASVSHGGSQSDSWLGRSFRAMIGRERSSRRAQSCGDHEVGPRDLERQ